MKTSAERMRETRARRKADGLCLVCGAPAAISVTYDGSGSEVSRKTLQSCPMHLTRKDLSQRNLSVAIQNENR